MKILFHTHSLNFRGTAVAIYDYARYNEEILGNESIICYNKTIPYERDMGTEDESVANFNKRFKVISYSNPKELSEVCDTVDFAYFIRAGHYETIPDNVRTGVHAVFQHKDPHGDVYAYISEWLANKMSGGTIPYVPHIVSLPEPNGSYRERFNLEGKTVIGRFGGFYKFDIPFVRDAVVKVLESSKDHVFFFVNTQPFIKHERVIYADTIVDLQKKSNYINSCDAFLHARQEGESFGLALCESLYFNKPTLAWCEGRDQHHVALLKDTNLLYTQENIVDKLLNVKSLQDDYASIVHKFNPTGVMKKFKEVFLK